MPISRNTIYDSDDDDDDTQANQQNPTPPPKTSSTASMMSKKRAREEPDDDPDPEDATATKRATENPRNVKKLKSLGRLIARTISLTVNIDDALIQTYLVDEDFFSPYHLVAMKEIHSLIQKHVPSLLAKVLDGGMDILSRHINGGMRDAHNQDVRDLKKVITTIYELDEAPKEKSDWGFRYPGTAHLLRPIDVEENDPFWKELCAGSALPPTNSWPAFMYDGRNGPPCPDRVSVGFLLDDALIRVARLVLFPPRFLNKEFPPSSGFASQWGIKEVTIPLIAYVIEIIHFVLSSEVNYGNRQFNYHGFYDNIVDHLSNPKLKKQTDDILAYWNSYIFPKEQAPQSSKTRKGIKTLRVSRSSTSRFIAEIDLNTENGNTATGTTSGLDILARSALNRSQPAL